MLSGSASSKASGLARPSAPMWAHMLWASRLADASAPLLWAFLLWASGLAGASAAMLWAFLWASGMARTTAEMLWARLLAAVSWAGNLADLSAPRYSADPSGRESVQASDRLH